MPDGSCMSVKCGRYLALPLHRSTSGWFDFHDSVQMLVKSVVSSISVRFKYNFRGASGEATGSDVTGSGPDHNRKSRK